MAKKRKKKKWDGVWKRQYVIPINASDSPADVQALARELGGKVKGGNIVFEAENNQAAANAKVKAAALRITMKGK